MRKGSKHCCCHIDGLPGANAGSAGAFASLLPPRNTSNYFDPDGFPFRRPINTVAVNNGVDEGAIEYRRPAFSWSDVGRRYAISRKVARKQLFRNVASQLWNRAILAVRHGGVDGLRLAFRTWRWHCFVTAHSPQASSSAELAKRIAVEKGLWDETRHV